MNDSETSILDAAAEGALVLTANRRLERYLRDRYDDRMQKSRCITWNTPRIFGFDDWVVRTVTAEGEGAWLLDTVSALNLWETVIEGDCTGTDLDLLQVSATARRAMEAHHLLCEYGVEPDVSLGTADQAAFHRWRQIYQERCEAQGWLDPARSCDWLATRIEDGRLAAPNRLVLAGFDEIRPAVRRIARSFSAAGCRIEEPAPAAGMRGAVTRLCFADAETEIRQSIIWARRLMEQGETNIGIVVPRLTRWRPTLERIFREEVEPESLLPDSDDDARFGLSLGQKLGDQGVVVAALELLSAGNRLSMDRISFLLRTPYLGGSVTEASRRALFDARLRSLRRPEFGLQRLQALAGEEPRSGLNRFVTICGRLRDSLQVSGRQVPSRWAEHFSSLLDALGWPGERGLDSHDFQVLQAWREKLMPQLIRLDRVAPTMTRSRAVSLLRRLAADIDFQLQSPPSPIQVVGYLETAGLRFDHLWVMDLCEEVFPAPAAPNPFIPFALQSAHRMPHADGDREREFARLVVDRLLRSAPRVVVSHARRQGDADLRPSPLIEDIPLADETIASSRRPFAANAARAGALEEVADATGPPLPANVRARGGTAILKDQSLCPFRAFARHRLGAKGLEEPEIGLDARLRGTLLHRVLELFWDRTGDSGTLKSLSPDERGERIRQAVEKALQDARLLSLAGLSPALLDLERARLHALTEEWLTTIDMRRPPFTVEAREEEGCATFGEVEIETKIDRIDRTDSGDLVLIDYKTGSIRIDDLLADRLLEPQLPAYAVGQAKEDLAGVAFALVRRGECSLKGVCRQDDLLPGSEAFAGSRLAGKYGVESWFELQARWREQLSALGREFSRGEAAVRPVDPKKACTYCDLGSLCRIDELDLVREADE